MKLRHSFLSSSAIIVPLIASIPAAAQSQTPASAPARVAEQVAGKGSLTGQIIDPATGEYLGDATVEVTTASGDRRSTASVEGGVYRFVDLPSGPATITVKYTGYPDQTATVDIPAGNTLQQDFELHRQGQPAEAAGKNDIIVTASVREGDARAIMDQRQSMDIKNSLSAESYGDIADGNPGEFLKFMPGVDTDAGGDGDGTVRNVGLRGMPSEYTAVTLNGVSLSGVDAFAGAGGSRTFSFEQMSLSSIDSIEISKTISADVDANAPAGTINIKTKRAFDRRGRRITAQLSASTHSDLWDSNNRSGPAEGGYGRKRFLPNGQLEYSDSFFGRRLGVVASISQSNLYIEHEQTTLGRSYAPTAISPEPLAITTIETQLDQREISRFAASLNVDFKATRNLVLGVSAVYNKATIWAASTAYKFTTGARTRGVIGDPMFDITTQQAATTATFSTQNTLNYKKGEGKTFIPSFSWENGRLTIDGNYAYSSSTSTYDPQGEKDSAYVLSPLTARGNFIAKREDGDLLGNSWQIQQISGTDWSDPAAYSAPNPLILRTNYGPYAELTQTVGTLNATYRADFGSVPVVFKAGVKTGNRHWLYGDRTDDFRYRYVGSVPLGTLLGQVQGTNQYPFNDTGISIRTLNGGNALYTPSTYKLLELYRTHPEYWALTSATTASEFYNINVGNNRDFTERTDAVYGMATAELTRKLKFRAGLRWERTKTVALEADPLSAQEVIDAGFPVSATTGMATTIDGLKYQYLSRPKVERIGTYDYFFPSSSLKYEFNDNLQLQLGYSRTIRRPEVSDLTGVWRVDDINHIVTAANPGLKPEISDNFSARLAQYFEPVGLVAVNFYVNKVKGLFQTQELTAQEFGYTGPEYSDYTFRTTSTVSGEAISIKGWEFELNHSLDYLPGLLNGFSVRGSLMINHPDVPIVRVADKIGTFSVSYKKGPVRLHLNTVWTDEKYRSTTPSYYDDFWDMSLSGSVKVSKRFETFFSVRNLLNSRRNVILPGSLAPEDIGYHSAVDLRAGVSGIIGVRGRF
ncbi:MAG TPA: TonB-dependent receptor [Sphingomonas sp.]|nr:TonB-dependent receptor [Sphingomonas sp.]